MGALEDDLDYGLTVIRQQNYRSHTLLDENAGWDNRLCTKCDRRGGVDLSFNACWPLKRELTVADVIAKLSQYNPRAEFKTVVRSQPQPFEFTYGSSDGCTMANCGDVCLMVGPQNNEVSS